MTDSPISASEAARLLGVSSATVRRYIRDGLLTERRTPGGHFRLKEEEVRALMRLGLAGRSGGDDDE